MSERWVAPPPVGVLSVDFDGVLRAADGQPVPGALEHMRSLRHAGYRIFVHTLRARSGSGESFVRGWLIRAGIPFDDVTAIKPDADFYIDDRAVRFTTWPEASRFVLDASVRG